LKLRVRLTDVPGPQGVRRSPWFLRLPVKRSIAGVAIAGLWSLATAAGAQGSFERPGSIHVGLGGGYTGAPNYPGESPGGDWNGEAILFVSLRGIPVDLRLSGFTYGRGTDGTLVAVDCPCAVGAPRCYCGSGYINGSGPERATGGALDAVIRLSRGPIVPYLVGGPAGVTVSRATGSSGTLPPTPSTVHRNGLGYECGAGARGAVGRIAVFGEVKFFGTSASAEQVTGHSVHMVPLTVGITF
jgi:hypothetical protein